MNINTDLALEVQEFAGNSMDGTEVTEKSCDGMHITRINIITEKAAEIFGKDKGTYITAEFLSIPAGPFSGSRMPTKYRPSTPTSSELFIITSWSN